MRSAPRSSVVLFLLLACLPSPAAARGEARAAHAAAPRPAAALLFDSEATRVRAGSADCITRELGHLDAALRWFDERRIRDAFFPWFEDALYASQPEEMTAVLRSKLGRQRAAELGLRYVVFLTGARSTAHAEGLMSCGGAGRIGGCLGAAVLRRESSLTATVWDFSTGTGAANLEGHGSSRDALLALVLPLWLPGGQSTKTLACRNLALTLNRILHGDPDGRLAQVEPPAADDGEPQDADLAPATGVEPEPAPLWPCLAQRQAPAAPDTDGARAPGRVPLADWAEWSFEGTALAAEPTRDASPPAREFGIVTLGAEDLLFEAYGDAARRFRLPLALVADLAERRTGSPAITVSASANCRAVFGIADRNPRVAAQRTAAFAAALRERIAATAAPPAPSATSAGPPDGAP